MDLRQPLLGHVPVEVELEPLSLSYVADALEPQPGKGTMHCLALRVEDFGLEHDVDDDTGHGTAPEVCGFGGLSLGAVACRLPEPVARWSSPSSHRVVEPVVPSGGRARRPIGWSSPSPHRVVEPVETTQPSSRFRILPVAVIGKPLEISTIRGYL